MGLRSLRAIRSAAGLVTAPWLFLAAFATRSPKLRRLTLKADPHYYRARLSSAQQWGSAELVGQLGITAALAAVSNAQSAKRIKSLFSLSEAQLLQDVFCLLILNEKRGGFFVEVGVGEGRSISNTYLLESQFDWNGILVEPNRSFHDGILASRKASLERRAAASKSDQVLQFREVLGEGEYSGLVGVKGHDGRGSGTVEYPVTSATLDEILKTHNAPLEIDYLSIDTEGSEVDILNGLNLHKYRFKVLTVEHNFDLERLGQIESMLFSQGYLRVFEGVSSFDAWFIHEDVKTEGLP